MSLGTLGSKVIGKVLGKAATKNKKKATEAVSSVRDRANKKSLKDRVLSATGTNFKDAKRRDGEPSKGRRLDSRGFDYAHMGDDVLRIAGNRSEFKGAGKALAGVAAAFGGVAAYEALPSKDKKSFDTAFAKARRNEEKTFTWRGDSYNTKLQRNSQEIKKAESRISKDKPKPPTKSTYFLDNPKLNKGGMVTKSRMGNMDYRQGGLLLSSVDNRKKKK